MFYLKKFFGLFFENFVWSFCFAILSFSLIFVSTQKNFVEKKIQSVFKENIQYSHFFALIDLKKNILKIQRRMYRLPGIYQIEIINSDKVANTTEKVVVNWNLDIPSHLAQKQYAGLKVVFKENLSLRSKELIREYLIKLVGKDNVTLGSIVQAKRSKSMDWLHQYAIAILLLSVGVIWIFTLMPLATNWADEMTMLEKFQRSPHTGVKVVASGLSSLYIIGNLLSCGFGPFELSGLVLPLVLFLVGQLIFMRKYRCAG